MEVIEETQTNVDEVVKSQLDVFADSAIEVTKNILSIFGEENSVIEEYENEEGKLFLNIEEGNLAILIGRHGHTLQALNTLVRALVNKKTNEIYPLAVDIENYNFKRSNKVVSIAQNIAQRVLDNQKSIKMKPMTPYDRRIVHTVLSDVDGIKTFSVGREPYRCVVVDLT